MNEPEDDADEAVTLALAGNPEALMLCLEHAAACDALMLASMLAHVVPKAALVAA